MLKSHLIEKLTHTMTLRNVKDFFADVHCDLSSFVVKIVAFCLCFCTLLLGLLPQPITLIICVRWCCCCFIWWQKKWWHDLKQTFWGWGKRIFEKSLTLTLQRILKWKTFTIKWHFHLTPSLLSNLSRLATLVPDRDISDSQSGASELLYLTKFRQSLHLKLICFFGKSLRAFYLELMSLSADCLSAL